VSFSFSYRELITTGLAGAFLAFLASKWHLPGVLLGALSPMASLVIMAIVKSYLSGAAIGDPRFPGLLYIFGAFWWFASQSAGMRQAILLAGLRAGAAASVISAAAVAGTEIIAGEDVTCLIWQECQQGAPPPPPPDEPTIAVGPARNAVAAAPDTVVEAGGGLAFVIATLLIGSGAVTAAIMRRRG
jgi:hypothetical protein